MNKARLLKFVTLLTVLVSAPVWSAAQTAPAPAPVPAAPAAAKPVPPPRTPESAVTPELKNENRHKDFLERIQHAPVDLLFLGDSITDSWPRRGEWSWLQFARYNPADFGISGDRTEHVLWRIENGELDGISPKLTVIMIGTNNIGHFPDERPEWAANGVKRIVEVVREKLPQTKILLLAIFPRDTKDSDRRHRVTQINAIIARLDDGKTVRYLDIGDRFLDANGELPADIMPDKLHPTPKGYNIWYHAIAPTVDEMMK